MSVRKKKSVQEVAADILGETPAPPPPPPLEPEATSKAETKDEKEWKHFAVNVKFSMAVPSPVWVVRVKSKTKSGGWRVDYVRLPTSGGMLLTPERRMATRMDSALWAETIASVVRQGFPKHKVEVRRLWTKTEREAEEDQQRGSRHLRHEPRGGWHVGA